jgi:hypothetical protein
MTNIDEWLRWEHAYIYELPATERPIVQAFNK